MTLFIGSERNAVGCIFHLKKIMTLMMQGRRSAILIAPIKLILLGKGMTGYSNKLHVGI